MKIKLQKFIKSKSFQEIKSILENAPYFCNIKEYGNYYLIHYNQIKSDFSIPMVQELRGIILEKESNRIVCYPFNKFFNYGESYAIGIDWLSARIEEKIDGSFIKIWYHNDIWNISTMSTINAKDADLPDLLNCPYKNFKDLILKAFENNNFKYTELDKNYTHMFELVSLYNKIVIAYPDIDIYYLNSRNMKTFKEEILDVPLKRPKQYVMKSLEEVISVAKELPFNEEGYVVVDKHWNRIKVKSPKYVAVHYIRNNGSLNSKRFLKLIMEHEEEEFLSYYPEYKSILLPIKQGYDHLVNNILNNIEYIDNHIFNNRKEFALWSTKQVFPAILFQYYDKQFKKENIKIYMKYNIRIDSIVSLLN